MTFKALSSMRRQASTIIIAGFLLSHSIGLLLYSRDRSDALFITEALDIAERAAGISRLVRDLSPSWRTELLNASDSRAFRVWPSDQPAFQYSPPSESEEDVLGFLRSQLPRLTDRDMRVRFATSEPDIRLPPDRWETPGTTANAPVVTAVSPTTKSVLISISHADGEWLNFLGQINTPQSALPEFLGTGLISAVFAIGLVAFWLVDRVTMPLSKLAQAAERLGRNINAEPLPESGPLEVATAAVAFNRMQHRLVRLIEGRTELLAAISHDLRTPITQMRLRTELMNHGDDQEKMLAVLDDMEAIVATFLDYARAANETEERKKIDLGALVESLCNDISDTGAKVYCEAQEGLLLECKRLALKRGITNLIDNALKYGGSARVQAFRSKSNILVIVDDDGPGISPEDLEEVFVPFKRGESSRNRDSGGIGLGLSIVQAVAEDHGGKVKLANRNGGGLRAEMRLPI